MVLRLGQLKPGDVAVSALSRFEAEAALRAQPRLPARLGRLLREFLGAVRVLDFGSREAQQAAALAAATAGSTQLSALDLMIAATALEHGLVLATSRPGRYAEVPNLDVEQW